MNLKWYSTLMILVICWRNVRKRRKVIIFHYVSDFRANQVLSGTMGNHPHTKTHDGPKSMPIMMAINKWADEMPAFTDVFDEDNFFIFAGVFTLLTCLATVVASRYIKLKCRE